MLHSEAFTGHVNVLWFRLKRPYHFAGNKISPTSSISPAYHWQIIISYKFLIHNPNSVNFSTWSRNFVLSAAKLLQWGFGSFISFCVPRINCVEILYPFCYFLLLKIILSALELTTEWKSLTCTKNRAGAVAFLSFLLPVYFSKTLNSSGSRQTLHHSAS